MSERRKDIHVNKTLHLEIHNDGIALVRIDLAGSKVNTLGPEFPAELDEILDQVERHDAIHGLLFISAKRDSFVVGADLEAVRALTSVAELEALSRRAQRSLNRLASLEQPTAAAIHGTCLGGGLELALACDMRIATSARGTRLGQPEVQLGLCPGAGATQRLPRLVPLPQALELLLTGTKLGASQALDMGLVDEVCPPERLLETGCARLLDHSHPGEEHGDTLGHRVGRFVTEGNPLSRWLILDRARKHTLARTRGNMPAPMRIIEVIESGLLHGMESGLEAEAVAFGELAMTPESRELVRLFFVRRELEHESWVEDGVQAREIGRVGVVGAGTMGGGIAYITAAADIPVRLRDVSDDAVACGLRAVRHAADHEVAKGAMTEFERDRLMHRVGGTTTYSGFGACDLVIEAVPEDLELKHQVLGEVESSTAALAIHASNTSSLPIARIAEVSGHPEMVIGMHYFSPVTKVPLLELVVTKHTAPVIIASCVALGRRQGKLVIVVEDRVGFYTTRILGAYMNEALGFLERGAPIEHIDEALLDFGFPMGPLALADSVGIDVVRDIGVILEQEYGERFTAPRCAATMARGGRLGQKNGRGFYHYADRERSDADTAVYTLLGLEPKESAFKRESIAWRCALRMVDEAVRCRAEGVLRSERDGDAGAVFGLGFPPFRGGPFRMIERLGAAAVVQRMRGHELRPCDTLLAMASEATKGEAVGG